jgi:hypothetical protein
MSDSVNAYDWQGKSENRGSTKPVLCRYLKYANAAFSQQCKCGRFLKYANVGVFSTMQIKNK